MCLADEATAKKCVPLFVQELGRATNPAVDRLLLIKGLGALVFHMLCNLLWMQYVTVCM